MSHKTLVKPVFLEDDNYPLDLGESKSRPDVKTNDSFERENAGYAFRRHVDVLDRVTESEHLISAQYTRENRTQLRNAMKYEESEAEQKSCYSNESDDDSSEEWESDDSTDSETSDSSESEKSIEINDLCADGFPLRGRSQQNLKFVRPANMEHFDMFDWSLWEYDERSNKARIEPDKLRTTEKREHPFREPFCNSNSTRSQGVFSTVNGFTGPEQSEKRRLSSSKSPFKRLLPELSTLLRYKKSGSLKKLFTDPDGKSSNEPSVHENSSVNGSEKSLGKLFKLPNFYKWRMKRETDASARCEA